MPLSDRKSHDILQNAQYDFSKIKSSELEHIVNAVARQDAGNYDGKFVGMVSMTELVLRSNDRTQKITLGVAILSLIASLVAIFK